MTMVDFLLSLRDRGHTGPVHVVSRRGLLPHRHADQGEAVPWAGALPHAQAELLRLVRRRCDEAGDWRAVIDGLRPRVQEIWTGWSDRERRRFLRHLRPWWDIHRHRLAPAVAARIGQLIAEGHVTVTPAKVLSIDLLADGMGVEVTIRPRGKSESRNVRTAMVVNCSGPASDYRRVRQPLIRSLLECGHIRPDALRLGLDITEDLRVIAANGRPAERLYAAGPVSKGRLWEITAVPEIRRQCQTLAQRIVQQLAR